MAAVTLQVKVSEGLAQAAGNSMDSMGGMTLRGFSALKSFVTSRRYQQVFKLFEQVAHR